MEGVPPEDLARHIEKKEREWGGNAQKKQRVADPDAIRAQFAAFQDSQSAPLPDGMGSANSYGPPSATTPMPAMPFFPPG
ncbi:hypothetical protein HDU91_002623 [Kappamyces sp. JEL0680]|nr:hypothetical protein HDU91_002623 [Kappamyces sp. JEL0680]